MPSPYLIIDLSTRSIPTSDQVMERLNKSWSAAARKAAAEKRVATPNAAQAFGGTGGPAAPHDGPDIAGYEKNSSTENDGELEETYSHPDGSSMRVVSTMNGMAPGKRGYLVEIRDGDSKSSARGHGPAGGNPALKIKDVVAAARRDFDQLTKIKKTKEYKQSLSYGQTPEGRRNRNV